MVASAALCGLSPDKSRELPHKDVYNVTTPYVHSSTNLFASNKLLGKSK